MVSKTNWFLKSNLLYCAFCFQVKKTVEECAFSLQPFIIYNIWCWTYKCERCWCYRMYEVHCTYNCTNCTLYTKYSILHTTMDSRNRDDAVTQHRAVWWESLKLIVFSLNCSRISKLNWILENCSEEEQKSRPG